jgi:hypothetical protein
MDASFAMFQMPEKCLADFAFCSLMIRVFMVSILVIDQILDPSSPGFSSIFRSALA